MQTRNQIFVLAMVLLFSACKENIYERSVNDINLNLEIDRFEQDLFSLNLDSLKQGVDSLKKEYGTFPELFSNAIINIGSTQSPAYIEYLKRFLTDYMIYRLYGDVTEMFPSVNEIEQELENGFKRYKSYFPKKTIPRIITYISGYNHSVAVDDSLIAIGLDKYMGENYEDYQRLGYAKYQRINMRSERIPIDCMKAWAITEWPFNDSVDNLINHMIYEGQIQFFLKSMFPESPDSVILGFTASQMKFCEKNESRMWVYLIENKHLFSTDKFLVSKYIDEAPYTKGFSDKSPGEAAVWLGWRIVEDYMRRNKNVSLEELMNNSNYQQILTLSNYHP